jgi:hypothetical protein
MRAHDQDLQIRYYDMDIDGLEGHFVVAKLRRISSSPVLVGSVADAQASALGRLIDIFRLGTESRNYADLQAIERLLQREFGISADQEWGDYLQVIRQVKGVDHLDVIQPLLLKPQPGQPDQRVVIHKAEMNERPYLVARIGDILASPAAVWLNFPKEKESALARLANVFHIGVRGQAFRDFMEMSRKQSQGEAEILAQWRTWEQSVAWEAGGA